MSEMVERVARALEPRAWSALASGDSSLYKIHRQWSLRKARAAIEAMRDPTADMLDAVDMPNLRRMELQQIWRALIDSTLRNEALP